MHSVRNISRSSVAIASRRFASFHNYYDVLGVRRTATATEIRQAFIELSKKHHPDKQHGNAELFKQINEAYSVLSQKQLRTGYDASLASWSTEFRTNPPHPADYEFWKQNIGAHRYPFTPHDRMGKNAATDDHSIWFFHSVIGFTILIYVISFFYFVRLTHSSTVLPPLSGRFGAYHGRNHMRLGMGWPRIYAGTVIGLGLRRQLRQPLGDVF